MTHEDMIEDDTNGTDYTFTNRPIGTDETGRILVLFVGIEDGAIDAPDISAITFGGSTPTLHYVRRNSGTARGCAVWVYTETLSGTQATVDIDFDETVDHCGISIYKMMNASAEAPDDFADDINDSNESAFDISNPAELNVASGGAAIGYVFHQRTGAHTWLGITMDDNNDVGVGSSHSSAHGEFASGDASLTITGTVTTGRDHVAVAASWDP